MSQGAPSLLRSSAPLARAALAITRRPSVRALAKAATRRLDAAPGARTGERHPMMPAAVRVERARSRRDGETAEQTAVTLWFGEGPALPSPGGSTMRTALRLGGGLLGAAALAAMTAIAARREEARGTVIEAPVRPPTSR